MSNFLSRFQVEINHFTQSEIAAQKKALDITTQAKTLLESKQVVTVEALTGTADLGAATLDVVNQFIAALNSPAITGIAPTTDALLGGFGAQLTAAIHEGEPILHGIAHWIFVFETLFHLNKKAA